ncbi:CFA74 protein, partial [Rostratula benghalensis]|nr:CFA74 protein [Rostratula benghalensis]
GRGVTPTTVCSVGEELDMGYVIAREKGTSTFKIQNTCPVALQFSIQLDSLSSTRDKDQQEVPPCITSPLPRTEFVGTQNCDGLSVFSIFPTEGEIAAGKSQDFTVTFSPDRESPCYSDRLTVLLFGKETAHVIHLKGAARDHPMFVEGGVPLDVPVESLAVTSPTSRQEALKGVYFIPICLEEKPVKSILLLLEYFEGESSPAPARAELRIGSIPSQLASKKPLEFSFETPPLLHQKGFTIAAAKGRVERGQVKGIAVSWAPPAGSRVS